MQCAKITTWTIKSTHIMYQKCGICNAKILHAPCCLLLWSGVLSQELQFLSTFLLKMYTLPLMFHLRDGSSVYSTRLVRLDSLLIKSQVKLVTQTFSDSTHPYSTCTIPWWWSVAGLVAELKLIFCCSGLTLSRLNWVPPAAPFFFSIDQSKQKGNVSLITSKF